MPTYEYECTKCGAVFELFQSITEPPRRRLKSTDPRPCKCDAPVARRISTGGGIIFKGSGFYQTDYRSEKYKQAAKAESETGSSKSDGDGAGKTDGKTGEKKEKAQTKPKAKCGT